MTTKVKEDSLSLSLNIGNIKQAVKSYTMSRRYMKTMLKACITNILYHRICWEETEFITKSFKRIKYRCFKEKSHNKIVNLIHTYLAACKDAFEKKYLREFCLFLVEENTGKVLEFYKFSFKYRERQDESVLHCADALVKDTCDMFQTLEDLGQHMKYQQDIIIKAELSYFDGTPDNYSPPGLAKICYEDSLANQLSQGGNVITLGSLNTGFHKVKCTAKGKVFNFKQSETTEGLNEAAFQKQFENAEGIEENLENMMEENVPNEELQITHNMNETYFSQNVDDKYESMNEDDIDCPCLLKTFTTVVVDLLKCTLCKRCYHAPCQGYKDNGYVKDSFICSYCQNGPQPSIVEMRVRLVMAIYDKYDHVPKEFNALVSDSVLQRIETVLQQGGKGACKKNFHFLQDE